MAATPPQITPYPAHLLDAHLNATPPTYQEAVLLSQRTRAAMFGVKTLNESERKDIELSVLFREMKIYEARIEYALKEARAVFDRMESQTI